LTDRPARVTSPRAGVAGRAAPSADRPARATSPRAGVAGRAASFPERAATGLDWRVESYAELAARILGAEPPAGVPARIVAVDGRGAAGKTTFAARLARALPGARVAHTDDVADRVGHPWWPTLEAEVLADPGTGVLLIEGVSSSRRAIAGRLTYGIWLTVPAAPRLARAIARDGPAAAADWDRYEAEETAFFAGDPAWERADLVVDGAPAIPHDPQTEYVRRR
jgi:predicted kinase